MPQVTLHVLSGPYQGRSVRIRRGEICRLGKSDQSDLVFAKDPYLSGVHFQIDCSASLIRIRDLGSQHGTYVNGERQLVAMIQNGDVIQTGQTQFRAEVAGERPESEKPDPMPPELPDHDPTRPYASGIQDEDPLVRHEALLAAAWARQRWLLEYCRHCCARPAPGHWEAIHLLAIIGEPVDLKRMLDLGRTTELGPRRFQVLGAFGHPGLVDELVVRLESKDTATAVAAAMTFTKITGIDIQSDREVEIAFSVEDFNAASTNPMMLPDSAMAAAHWRQSRSRFLRSTRWCRGFDVSRGTSPMVLEAIDMESRFEACLRDHFHGRRMVNPVDLWVLRSQ